MRWSPGIAQHAVRQAKVLADNVVAFLRAGELRPYRHVYAGSVAGLGHHQGVAQVYGIRLTGFPGWLAHRHWTLALFFRRETAQLMSSNTQETNSGRPDNLGGSH